jgi:Protein of unknown function (DUF3105)
MAKTSKDRDRRAVVEQLRREQQRAERRRTMVVVSACVVVALVIIALAAVPLIRQKNQQAKPLAELGASTGSAGCTAVVKKKATGNQQHRQEGTDITYPDAPPAFGPHYPIPAPIGRKFYTAADRPRLEYVVHNLEHGYTLFWYDDTIAADKDQVAVIKAIAAKFTGTKQTDKFIALPWTAKDGKPFPDGTHVALTHWSAGGAAASAAGDVARQRGVWEYCARPSGAVVSSFTKQYPYSDSPEPQAA